MCHRINIVALNWKCYVMVTTQNWTVSVQFTIIYYIPWILIQPQEKEKKFLLKSQIFLPGIGFHLAQSGLERESCSSCLYLILERQD